MFPDAPTLRGLRHLEELESLAAQGQGAGILFLLMKPQARSFTANLHTDPAFARKLISLRDRIWMHAVSMGRFCSGRDGMSTRVREGGT
jgi:DNA-binding sugar fermentation-stimulating protein